MKVVILAGGYGTRLSEETSIKPKPMVEIGGEPILWHIMNIYSHYGFNDFIICLGYKGEVIKDYFINYYNRHSDIVVDLKKNSVEALNSSNTQWNVLLVDTGLNTMTGGRLKRIEKYIDGDTFLMTYGDGLSNVNIDELISFHRNHKKLVTLTAVQPEGRFGALHIDKTEKVINFEEKPMGDGLWVNGGFFVVNREAIKLVKSDDTMWEREPIRTLADSGELVAYKHGGFWKPMDTLSDKMALEKLWNSGNPPWKVWDR